MCAVERVWGSSPLPLLLLQNKNGLQGDWRSAYLSRCGPVCCNPQYVQVETALHPSLALLSMWYLLLMRLLLSRSIIDHDCTERFCIQYIKFDILKLKQTTPVMTSEICLDNNEMSRWLGRSLLCPCVDELSWSPTVKPPSMQFERAPIFLLPPAPHPFTFCQTRSQYTLGRTIT